MALVFITCLASFASRSWRLDLQALNLDDLSPGWSGASAFDVPATAIDLHVVKLHIPLRRVKRREAKLRVQPVCVQRDQTPATQSLKLRMLHDAFHEQLSQSLASARFDHKQVTNVSVCRVVRDHTRKAHLLPAAIWSKAKRILDRARHHFAGYPLGPVGLCQETIDQIQI